ncbi:hypothetical protein OGAPHI_005101 [Ogataea philodendri]|uniref:Uncharacterized protein n=1 Tax=Ogataea philodendri TaxID=1378263 RepID=A0A9P8P222_9ASCO|nr:uncharacterized protein OGAPHI_005101 [Ogataea philodendri]KAH3663700.1 hypothetical protein OGAPHI_005101 [Ogataea philodendri]
MKMSQPLANNMGASAEIIFTSSSVFITFLILASGSWWFLKSWLSCSMKLMVSCQYCIIMFLYLPLRPCPTLLNAPDGPPNSSESFSASSSTSFSTSPLSCDNSSSRSSSTPIPSSSRFGGI